VGNSYGLAIGSTGEVFIGASNCHPISPGRILRVGANGDVADFATGLGLIHDIVFDNSGNMYVADFNYGDDSGGRLVKVSPNGTLEIFPTGAVDLLSIVPIQETGEVIGFDTNSKKFVSISPYGDIETISYNFGGDPYVAYLSSDEDGNIIALVWFNGERNPSVVHRGLFKITSDGQITHIMDIDTPPVGSEDDIYVAPNGDIFIIGVSDEDAVSRLLRITSEGEVSLFADNLPFSTQSIAVNQEGDVYFTCAAGLFRIYKE
jgi:hypothetical protein